MHGLQAKGRTALISSRQRIALVILLVAGVDYVTKAIALAHLGNEPVHIFGTFLQFHLLHNSGAAFSLAANKTTLLSAFSLAVGTLILIKARAFTHKVWQVAAGLVVGGITGNLIDRIFRAPGALAGEVVDWIELKHWPTFNLADSSIVIGAILAATLTMKNIQAQSHDCANPRSKSDQHKVDHHNLDE